ncbi:hypothetical protein ST37_02420 [Vibrio sp. qd031]|nr:hypothetical protein ST37_02420 [Vibrio sp. qd031]
MPVIEMKPSISALSQVLTLRTAHRAMSVKYDGNNLNRGTQVSSFRWKIHSGTQKINVLPIEKAQFCRQGVLIIRAGSFFQQFCVVEP